MSRRIAIGLVALFCAATVGTAAAAPASGGRHFPHFSLMNEKLPLKKLPFELQFSFRALSGPEEFAGAKDSGHGPVWFGEVERPKSTIEVGARGHRICDFEVPAGNHGSSGGCTTPRAAREFEDFGVSACGKGRPRHFRVHALVPNGFTGVALERADGSIGRTIPVLDNTIAFTVGREEITMRGVGTPAAEELERHLPLAEAGMHGDGRGGCSSFIFFEAKSKK